MPVSKRVHAEIKEKYYERPEYAASLIKVMDQFEASVQEDAVFAIFDRTSVTPVSTRQSDFKKSFVLLRKADLLYDATVYGVLKQRNTSDTACVLNIMSSNELFDDKYYKHGFLHSFFTTELGLRTKKIDTLLAILASEEPIALVNLLVKYKDHDLFKGNKMAANFQAIVRDRSPVSLTLEMAACKPLSQEDFDRITQVGHHPSVNINEGRTLDDVQERLAKSRAKGAHWLDALESDGLENDDGDSNSSRPKS